MELPPRARRIRRISANGKDAWGTTSACAENTATTASKHRDLQNYLRVRGEYSNTALNISGKTELPPRARRILYNSFLRLQNEGTTSACAENTAYPRRVNKAKAELPPRARRIHKKCTQHDCYLGTTSACAENTWTNQCAPGPKRNYLRVRGEYKLKCSGSMKNMELPPRARRILENLGPPLPRPGTTSACAENTAV